jgi:hypothetical protein
MAGEARRETCQPPEKTTLFTTHTHNRPEIVVDFRPVIGKAP